MDLGARATVSNWSDLDRDVWRLTDGSVSGDFCAVLIDEARADVPAAPLYVSTMPDIAGPGRTVHVPDLPHLAPDDVVVISADGRRLNIAWKSDAVHNGLLLTERCEHYCLMCSQPPKERDDGYLYDRAKRIISALPPSAKAVSFTGGEPTFEPQRFLELLRHTALVAPSLSTHILSNGRRFSDASFVRKYGDVGLHDVMVGIPLYGAEPSLHDYVVQSKGAFDETVRGILNLAAAGQRVEIRVVLQRETIPALREITTFIARNLPFVEQVALMGLEMTGLARPNNDIVWIDPYDYRKELRDAHGVLSYAGISTRIYNLQLCVLDPVLWPAAVRSISDWKNDFPPLCEPCEVRDRCAGVFSTSGNRLSAHLKPVVTAPAG